MVTGSNVKPVSLKPQAYPKKSKQSWLMGTVLWEAWPSSQHSRINQGKKLWKRSPVSMYYVFFCLASCKMLRKLQCCSCEQWGWRETGQAGCGCQEQPQQPWTQHWTRPWAEAVAAPHLFHSLGHSIQCRTTQHLNTLLTIQGKNQQNYRWDFPLLTLFSITHKIMMEWFSITHMATDKQELDIKQSQCFKKIPNPQHLHPPKCHLTSAPISVNFCRQNPDGTREWYRPPRARMKLFK